MRALPASGGTGVSSPRPDREPEHDDRSRTNELLTPLFIGIEVLFGRLFNRWGRHCWVVAQKRGAAVFAESTWETAA